MLWDSMMQAPLCFGLLVGLLGGGMIWGLKKLFTDDAIKPTPPNQIPRPSNYRPTQSTYTPPPQRSYLPTQTSNISSSSTDDSDEMSPEDRQRYEWMDEMLKEDEKPDSDRNSLWDILTGGDVLGLDALRRSKEEKERREAEYDDDNY